MKIEGKIYKSLSFTVLKDKLLNKTKTQTIRTLYIPKYKIGEKIALVFKNEKKEKEFLYFVEITDVFPLKLKSISLRFAKRDGFETVEECQQCLMKLNHCDLEQWSFIIQWRPL